MLVNALIQELFNLTVLENHFKKSSKLYFFTLSKSKNISRYHNK